MSSWLTDSASTIRVHDINYKCTWFKLLILVISIPKDSYSKKDLDSPHINAWIMHTTTLRNISIWVYLVHANRLCAGQKFKKIINKVRRENKLGYHAMVKIIRKTRKTENWFRRKEQRRASERKMNRVKRQRNGA